MRLAILGTVGIPACYGGFETLVENLVHYADGEELFGDEITVYCSAKSYSKTLQSYRGAQLRYSKFNANGKESVLYDSITAIDALIRGNDQLLFLGVSGAIVIPFLRLFSKARITINVDGIEWRRDKWRGFSRWFLRWSEKLAIRYSHQIIADNQGIADYLGETYGVDVEVIAYGGDHAILVSNNEEATQRNRVLPQKYALALCRIEPENNVNMILDAFDGSKLPLVFVGNWKNSLYGRSLIEQYGNRPNLYLLDSIYEHGPLYRVREGASIYVHGHSAGGTNPALVEMMHFGVPVLAFDCTFNRYTTEEKAAYFSDDKALANFLQTTELIDNGTAMKLIAKRLYRWDVIGQRYFSLLRRNNN